MNGMNAFSNGDAAWNREERDKQFGRCNQDCNQGRECDCVKIEPLKALRHEPLVHVDWSAGRGCDYKPGQPMPLIQTMEGERIKELEKIIRRQQFIEDRYEELMLAARRVRRYCGVNQEMFDASVRAMDSLIQRHAREIDEMEEKDEG